MQFWMIKAMHRWLGLAFGAFFFVICLSGVVVTLDQMVRGSGSGSSSGQAQIARPLPVAQIIEDMVAFERRALLPEGADILIDLPTSISGPISAPISEGAQAAYSFRQINGDVALYADGQSPAALANRGSAFSALMWNVHANLLNLFGAGNRLVIWSGMAGAYLSLLGLIIFIPRRRTFRKNSILHPQELSFREVQRAHFSSGIVFFVLVIFFGVTGWAAGTPQTAEDILRPQSADLSYSPAPDIAPRFEQILQTAMGQMNRGEYMSHIRLTEDDGRDAVYIYMGSDDAAMTRRIVIDRKLGKVVAQDERAPQSIGVTLNANMADWHSGAGQGVLYKILLCAAGLIAGLIALTGFVTYIWRWKIQIAGFLRRRKAKETAK